MYECMNDTFVMFYGTMFYECYNISWYTTINMVYGLVLWIMVHGSRHGTLAHGMALQFMLLHYMSIGNMSHGMNL